MSTTAREPADPVRRAAGRIDDGVVRIGETLDFSRRVVVGVYAGRVRRYAAEVLRQANILASGSIFIVLALVFAFGLGLGVQSAFGARLVGAPSIAALGPAIGGLRELIPFAFAWMMAAKVSTGYVAEIGTMRIADEIDALDVIGMDSLVYLCSTRLLATWLILPFLYGIAVVVGFIASYISIVVQIGQVSAGGYFELFWKFQNASDLLFSGAKGLVMATYVVLVGVFYGYNLRGGPVEVGRACARAMAANLVGIHLIGVLTSQIFWGGAANLPVGG
jgi:phospholipid/cholesterol/gamma-HCH transport system permease protein